MVGSTAATITGSLNLNSQLPTDMYGAALVEAATAQGAIAQALVGTITIQVGAETIQYTMGPGSVGIAAAEHRPFLYTGGSIWLEDLANSVHGSDWDYNDHSWMANAVEIAPPPPPPPPPPTPPPPVPPTVSIGGYMYATEGGADGMFAFMRTGDTGAELTVSYTAWASGGGLATPNADYTAASTVTFAAGANFASLAIHAIDDSLVEGTETVGLYLTGGSGYQVSTMGDTASIALIDNDAYGSGTVTITSSGTLTEGDTAPGWFNIHRTDASAALTLDYSMPYGSATVGSDYTGLNPAGGTAYFAVGQSDVTLQVYAIDDAFAELQETIGLSLFGPWMGSAQIFLNDNDTAVALPMVSIAGFGNTAEGGAPGAFRFTRTGSNAAELVVTYSASMMMGYGIATPNTDYTTSGTSGTVTFAAGSSTADLAIHAIEDALVEGTETVELYVTTTMYGGAYQVGAGSSASIALADNDTPVPPPTISLTVGRDATEAEESGDPESDDTQWGWFTFHRTGGLASALTVYHTAPSGTASAGADYIVTGTSPGNVTFAIGEEYAYFDVQAIDDALEEPLESITISLLPSWMGEYTVGSGSMNVTIGIVDNDAPVITPPTPGIGSISGMVWDDSADADGIREADEAGLGGRIVRLTDIAGIDLDAALTASNGTYSFAEVVVGSYRIEFDSADLTFSAAHQGSNTSIDSDADPLTGSTGILSVAANAVLLDIDAGVVPVVQPVVATRFAVQLISPGEGMAEESAAIFSGMLMLNQRFASIDQPANGQRIVLDASDAQDAARMGLTGTFYARVVPGGPALAHEYYYSSYDGINNVGRDKQTSADHNWAFYVEAIAPTEAGANFRVHLEDRNGLIAMAGNDKDYNDRYWDVKVQVIPNPDRRLEVLDAGYYPARRKRFVFDDPDSHTIANGYRTHFRQEDHGIQPYRWPNHRDSKCACECTVAEHFRTSWQSAG